MIYHATMMEICSINHMALIPYDAALLYHNARYSVLSCVLGVTRLSMVHTYALDML